MKIFIDCTQITRNKAGVGTYALNLVKGLHKRHNEQLQIFLLVQDDGPDFLIDQRDARNTRTIRVSSSVILGLTVGSQTQSPR